MVEAEILDPVASEGSADSVKSRAGKGLNSNPSNYLLETEIMSKPVKIDDDVYKKLNKYCGRERKKSVVASKAIKKYLEDKEEQKDNDE